MDSVNLNVNTGIPIIDISDLWNEKEPHESQRVVLSIAEACRDYGFFYIKNHGVEVQENVFKVWKDFVAQSESMKEKCAVVEETVQRGYYKLQAETTAYLLKDAVSDWRESFYMAQEIPDDVCKKRFPLVTQNNKWPQEPADFKDTVQTYFNGLKELAWKLISCLAVGLGLKKDFFDIFFSPFPMAQLGIYHYPSHSKTFGPDEFSLGEHTDYGLLTILLQDEVGGLEIQDENGQWIAAPPVPGTFVINLGDMLEVWSNGMYKATKHRVRKSQNGQSRLSAAFFYEPYLEAVIKPLPLTKPLISFKERELNVDIKIPVVYGEYLTEKYQGTLGLN